MRNILFGLIYLWLRDSKSELNEGTAQYICEHLDALKGTCYFSDECIKQFVETNFGEKLDEFCGLTAALEILKTIRQRYLEVACRSQD